MDLSIQQKNIINSTASHIVVNAAAAAGKTTILVSKIQKLINEGISPSDIVAITFTNAAAENIEERLTTHQGMFIGTLHSYVNNLLVRKGIDTHNIIIQEQFDQLFTKLCEHQECIQPIKYLFWDEVQDSTEEQFDLVLNYIAPEHWFLVGDWRQSIYSFRGARPDLFLSIAKREDVTLFNLNENYRNGRNILEYARSIIRTAGIDYIDNSISKASDDGKLIMTQYDPITLARFIKRNGNPGQWFVLARTNAQVENFSLALAREGIPYDTFKRAHLDNKQLNLKLRENTVKVLTIHTAKGLENDYVMVIGAQFYDIDEKCISYVAATRAKKMLVWTKIPTRKSAQKLIRNWET